MKWSMKERRIESIVGYYQLTSDFYFEDIEIEIIKYVEIPTDRGCKFEKQITLEVHTYLRTEKQLYSTYARVYELLNREVI